MLINYYNIIKFKIVIGANFILVKRETSENLVQPPLLLVGDFITKPLNFFGKAYKIFDNKSGNLPI